VRMLLREFVRIMWAILSRGKNHRRLGFRQGLDEYLYLMNYGRSESGTRGREISNAQARLKMASYYIA
jgi:hypothetical protein